MIVAGFALLLASSAWAYAPVRDLDIRPGETSRFPFERWSQLTEFADSEPSGPGVRYRSIEFIPGDVLVTNPNNDSDGIFTTLLEGPQSFSHVAVFAILEAHGKRFPAVIEIHEQGVRAVPLSVFLGPKFMTYAEVFRFTGASRDAVARVGQEALKLMAEPHGFDIYSDFSEEHYLTCTETAYVLLKRAGFPEVPAASRYAPSTARNLEVLGIQSAAGKALLMPDDFTRAKVLRKIGVVDNGQSTRRIARELVRREIHRLYATEVLKPAQFPFEYHYRRWAVERVQAETPVVAPVLLRMVGFRAENFPRGPATFLSLIHVAERSMSESVDETARAIARNGTPLEVRDAAEKGLWRFRALF